VNNNDLNTDALRKYLETVKAISDKLGLMDESLLQSGFVTTVIGSSGGEAEMLPGSLTRHFMHQARYAAFLARNLMILQTAMTNRDSDVMLFPGLDPGAWQPSTITGIPADAKNQELAAEFVQTMLSLEVQQFSYGTGLPVTRQGMAAQADALGDTGFGSEASEFDLDLDALVDQLKTVSIADTVLKDMIWETVERLCKGDLDIAGAVSEIEQNIRTYLAERA
jgi:ABC-type glycerol-3-phosphate transport system substrate-binding protein